MTKPGSVRIGISGWTYPPWRGVFFPKGLPQKQELAFAAERFRSIEINGTFYSLQRPTSFGRWREETPADFVFSVKAPRFITHMRRLRDVEVPIANFFASGVLTLGEKLGPVLWQFPPSFVYERERWEKFLALLPHDNAGARTLARQHDAHVGAASDFGPTAPISLRHAVEIRHPSYAIPEFIDLLRAHDVALVCADTVAWPRLMDVTSDFIYCRLHGSEQLYSSGYTKEAIDHWAHRVVAWAHGREPKEAEKASGENGPKRARRDVFVYFDNDLKVRAPFDAAALTERVDALL